MKNDVKKVAILGANKEGLSLLPLVLGDPTSKLVIIADPNTDAMLFKLMELGYRLAEKHSIRVSYDMRELKTQEGLGIIIDALGDSLTQKFLDSPEFRNVEKLTPMSAKLLWGIRKAAAAESTGAGSDKLDKAEKHDKLLTPLRELVSAVKLTSDRSELLSDMLGIAIETTKAERGSIMLVDTEENVLKMEVGKGMDEEIVRKIRVPLGDGVAGKVAKEGTPVIINGRASAGDFENLGIRRSVSSAISVPLSIGARIIGVLNVNSTDPDKAFGDDDLNFLVTLSGLVAEVIERSTEYERMRIDSAKFALWKKLETSLADKQPLHRRLNNVCRRIAEFVPGLTCFIYIYNNDSKRLLINSSSLKTAPYAGHVSFYQGEGIEGTVAQTKKEVILVDRALESGLKRVYMAFPMIAQGALVGVFAGHMISRHGLTKYNEAFLREMVALLSESIFIGRRNDDDMQRSRRMITVDEMGLELISLKDSKRLLPVIATASAEILRAEGAVMRLKTEKDSGFERVSHFGFEGARIMNEFSQIEEETMAEALRRKEPVIREFSEDVHPDIRSVISYPLTFESEVVGFLTLVNKHDDESPYPQPFNKSDSDVLGRFTVYVEKVISPLLGVSELRNFDIISPKLFKRRVDEELARAKRYNKKVVLMTSSVAGLAGVSGYARREFLKKLLTFIRDRIRVYDAVSLLDEESIGILFLETDRDVVEAFEKDVVCDCSGEYKKGICYGYAVYPDDGITYEELVKKASQMSKVNI